MAITIKIVIDPPNNDLNVSLWCKFNLIYAPKWSHFLIYLSAFFIKLSLLKNINFLINGRLEVIDHLKTSE